MPDPFHLLILIVTFLASVVLGGLIVGGILTASFELRPFDSQWISAFGTVLAAVGTVFTLWFLIYQNASQAEELRQERKNRKDHEDEQKNMWQEQREMLTFQKLQMHKSLFNDLLNELEVNHGIKFYNRTELYKNIFPDNNFSKFSAQVLPQSIIDAQTGSLQDSKTIYEKIVKSQTDYDAIQSSNFVHSHLLDLKDFIFLLHLTFPNQNNFGDITYYFDSKDYLIINIFDLERNFSICEEVFQHLCDFAGLEHSPIRTNLGIAFYTEAVFKYFFGQIGYGEFTFNLGQVRGSFIEIYKLITQLPKDSEFQDSAVSGVALLINGLFINDFKNLSEKDAIAKLLPQTRYLHELLEEDSFSVDLPNKKQDTMLRWLSSANARLSNRLKLLQKFNR